MKRCTIYIMTAIICLLSGCGLTGQIMDGDGMVNSYAQIAQDEAREMMARDDGHLIVDVRRPDEYDAGHIPGAICVPNEDIGTEMPAALPDRDQILLVYCRTGRRSKEAAQKLFDMGYSRVYEFGGITDWTGEIVTETPDVVRPSAMLVIQVGDRSFYAVPEDNPSAAAFTEKLSQGEIAVEMHDYGGFEKVGDLPWSLPRSDTRITTEPGDVILYQGNRITVYYGENTWDFTRLAKIGNVTRDELLDALGDGDVTIRFRAEWSE